MSKNVELNLSQISDGGLQEKFDREIQQVFANVQDLNTEATKKRKVVVTIEFIPDDSRETVNLNSSIKTTLAPQVAVSSTMLTGIDNQGRIVAKELKSGLKGQMFLDPDDNFEIKTDTGESPEVIDLQQQKKKAGN